MTTAHEWLSEPPDALPHRLYWVGGPCTPLREAVRDQVVSHCPRPDDLIRLDAADSVGATWDTLSAIVHSGYHDRPRTVTVRSADLLLPDLSPLTSLLPLPRRRAPAHYPTVCFLSTAGPPADSPLDTSSRARTITCAVPPLSRLPVLTRAWLRPVPASDEVVRSVVVASGGDPSALRQICRRLVLSTELSTGCALSPEDVALAWPPTPSDAYIRHLIAARPAKAAAAAPHVTDVLSTLRLLGWHLDVLGRINRIKATRSTRGGNIDTRPTDLLPQGAMQRYGPYAARYDVPRVRACTALLARAHTAAALDLPGVLEVLALAW